MSVLIRAELITAGDTVQLSDRRAVVADVYLGRDTYVTFTEPILADGSDWLIYPSGSFIRRCVTADPSRLRGDFC